MNNTIAENLSKIKSNIPDDVKLVAVSKTKPVSSLMEAYQLGIRDFGENKVQELLQKKMQMPADIRWHFIGHLQRNKVKVLLPLVYLIHSVDSFSLLEEIQKEAKKIDRVISVLLQVHIAQEETKFGFSYQELEDFVDQKKWSFFPNIEFKGLMGMGSNTLNIQQIELEFNLLSRFFDKAKKEINTFSELSIGMSGDYLSAIRYGSTMIRLGSVIFGNRP